VGYTLLELVGAPVGYLPSFEFTVAEGQSAFVSMEATFYTVLGVGTTGRITVSKWNGTAWETLSNNVDGGLLDLLGASGTDVKGAAEFTEPGRYRVQAVSQGVLGVSTNITIDGRVITFDLDEVGGYDQVAAHGNVIEASDADATTLVTEVNGQAVTGIGEKTVIVGQYGVLEIDVYGNYVYTPTAAGAGIGQVEHFTYTIRNAAGVTDTATLHIRIDSPDVGVSWPNWPDDPTQPAVIGVVADDDTASAAVNSAYKVTTGGPAEHAESALMTNGVQTRTATLQFTVDPDTQANVLIKALSPGNTVNNVDWTITVTDAGGNVVATFGKTESTGGYWAGFTLNKTLNDLAAGTYTVTATYKANSSIGAVNGSAPDTVELDYSFVSVTHLDEYVAGSATEVSGNVLADDTLASVFTKFLVQDENGDFVEVTGEKSITGEFGTLIINPDGSYTYTPNQHLDAINQVDQFTYRLEHPNGTVSDATLAITIENGTGPYVPPEPMMMAMSFGGDDVVPLGEFGDFDGDDVPMGALSLGEDDLFDLGDGEGDLDLGFGDDEDTVPVSGSQENGTGAGDTPPVEDPFAFIENPDDDDLTTHPII